MAAVEGMHPFTCHFSQFCALRKKSNLTAILPRREMTVLERVTKSHIALISPMLSNQAKR